LWLSIAKRTGKHDHFESRAGERKRTPAIRALVLWQTGDVSQHALLASRGQNRCRRGNFSGAAAL